MIITSDNYSEHSDHIGGKARELFRLAQKTGSVPPLFSVSAQSFHDFLCSRVDELREITSSNLGVVDISNRCRQLLEAESIDSQLADSILSSCIDGKLYSVRSSALQEDSDDHSFAGLFSTSLFVPKSKIIEQLRQCWLSAFSANIMEYCRINGIDPLDIRLGVVIQEMVDSVSSGVVFTANPTGSITEVAIVAGYGLGEGVVSNRVETDTYIYDKITNTLQKDVLRKTARLVFDKSSGFGVTQECVAADRSTVSVLDDEQIESLLAVVKTISDSFTQFLDIEWAMDNEGNIHVLQSRPITTIPKGRITVLDNNNIVESYPNVTLPLTASIAQKGYEKNFYNFFLSLNLPHAKARREVFRNLVGYVQGRLYYNLSNWYAMATLFPLPTRFTISSFDNMIGARHSSDFGSSRGEDGKSPFRALAFFATASWKFLCIRHYFKVFKDDFRALLRDYKSTNLEMLDNHQLIDLYSSAFTRFTEMAPNPLANDFFIMLFTGVTKRLLSSVALTDPDAVFNGLMCGEPGMDSVKPVHSVLHMAQLLRDDPKLYLQLKDNPRLLEEPSETIERREFLTAFNEHIELYGNRAPEELKMEVDTYKESPHLLLENILRYVPLDISAEKMATDELKIRRAAEKQLTNSLKGSPLKRLLLKFCINRVRLLLKNRESARMDRGTIHGIFRSVLTKLGENLQHEGALSDKRDVFYLTTEEINNFVYGVSMFDCPKSLIELRKKQFEGYKANRPEERLYFSGTIPLNLVKQKPLPRVSSNSVLVGVPCSPGKLECEAIVIRNLSEAGDVTGKIIVAPMTDPGWVFLMIAAAGIIVEKGSILSHTAIVGRELGIPTIVGIQDATEIIKSGQVIKMDAYSGEVQLGPLPERSE